MKVKYFKLLIWAFPLRTEGSVGGGALFAATFLLPKLRDTKRVSASIANACWHFNVISKPGNKGFFDQVKTVSITVNGSAPIACW
jgi:hypothetical protein